MQARLNGDNDSKITKYVTTSTPDDMVNQNVNNYDKDAFNGDIGRIDTEESLLYIRFDEREVSNTNSTYCDGGVEFFRR